MVELSSDIIKNALKKLIVRTNVSVGSDVYAAILEKYSKSSDRKYAQILKNLSIARKTNRPICQDTGVCIFFIEIGREFPLCSFDIKRIVEESVSEAYKENHFRKSMAENIFERVNTGDNTPPVIYIDIVDGDSIKFSLEVKGGGSENVSAIKMMPPSAGEEGVFEFIKETLSNAKDKGCPPYVIGVGLGGTLEKAAMLSKKALTLHLDSEKNDFEKKIEDALEDFDILGVRVLDYPTHIASMAVSVNLCCHCSRHGGVEIFSDGEVRFCDDFDYEMMEEVKIPSDDIVELNTYQCDEIKKLSKGTHVLLSGEIYTARDMAHKRMFDSLNRGEELPFDLKNKIIFYAGPCPNAPGEVIGPVGPTTSARMDKYLDMCEKQEVLATIGKGARGVESGLVYFTTTGGVACLLQQCIKKSELVAYGDLGPEAIYRLEVEKFPVVVS